MYLNNSYMVFDDFLDCKIIDTMNDYLNKDDFDSFFAKVNEINPNKNIIYKILYETWIKKLSFLCGGVEGFEVWGNTMSYDSKLDLHVDCDEHTLDNTGVLKNPLFTSVLYLGPKHCIHGGELAINLTQPINSFSDVEQMSFNINENEIKRDNINWFKIPYRYNRLVVFEATRPHLVLDIHGGTERSARSSLTMAAWDREIILD